MSIEYHLYLLHFFYYVNDYNLSMTMIIIIVPVVIYSMHTLIII